jgi:DNA polymerase III epsilon subunit-like protein
MTALLPEFYIIVDIESAGPTPDEYPMLSIGAATLDKPPQTFYLELQPDRSGFTPEALAISQMNPEQLADSGAPARQAMADFAVWVQEVTPEGHLPLFTAFNAPFDWMFVATYFYRYLGYNPFGHKALDIKALFMGRQHIPFQLTSHHHISKHFDLPPTLSHNALQDALQTAEILHRILSE